MLENGVRENTNSRYKSYRHPSTFYNATRRRCVSVNVYEPVVVTCYAQSLRFGDVRVIIQFHVLLISEVTIQQEHTAYLNQTRYRKTLWDTRVWDDAWCMHQEDVEIRAVSSTHTLSRVQSLEKDDRLRSLHVQGYRTINRKTCLEL